MKNLVYTITILMLCLNINISIACDTCEIALNHCPSVKDIKYQAGRLYANTKYNRISLSWIQEEFFPRPPEIDKFNRARVYCGGHDDCIVYCDYKLKNVPDQTSLELLYGKNKVTSTSGTNWTGVTCEALQPEQCQFVVSHR